MKVATVEEMREMDRRAAEEFGIAQEILMENAGLAATSVLDGQIGIQGKRFVLFCGVGNNGGDGFVVARKICSLGGETLVFIVGSAKKFKGAAKANYQILKNLPCEMKEITSAAEVRRQVMHSHGIIDALLGTGLDREVAGLHREVIELINKSGKSVLSLDIPSGVNGNTGAVMGTAVRADWTVTFGLPKLGNLLYPGYDLGGGLYVTNISFPPSLCEDAALRNAINDDITLPPRNPDAYKGSVGDVLFIAGSASYYGAPYFSALSLLKAGGGYARLAAPKAMAPFIAQKGSEIVFIPQKETEKGSIALANQERLLTLADKMDMVVIGPGLSLEQETQQLVRELVAGIGKPVLIDGDGITAICANLGLLQKRKPPTILTPHLGEMARLTGKSKEEVAANRVEILHKTARHLNAV
ncbi:MAG: NAD(P)H-hydrate epimerase, partial [Smithellaceae bacterium]|nr:NAD(P)H-hydrate epimerase [Smithellaceae bacterium]